MARGSSQNQLQKAALKGVKKFKHGIVSEMSSAFMAKIVKYDKVRHVADIQPLAHMSDGQESAQMLEVPVAENCYIIDEILDRLKPDFSAVDTNSMIPAHPGAPAHQNSHFIEHYPKHHFLRPGVPVVVAVMDRDITNWKGGRNAETFDLDSSRLHDENDGIIIAVLGGDAVNG